MQVSKILVRPASLLLIEKSKQPMFIHRHISDSNTQQCPKFMVCELTGAVTHEQDVHAKHRCMVVLENLKLSYKQISLM